MPTLEERVSYLEGKIGEHSKAWEDLKDMIIHLEGRINALDQKVDRRIDALDVKVERFREELSRRIDSLDQKFSRYFLWIIGIQVSIFLAIIASFLRR
jgi:predicted  nucleic acid-binding Zn-ribbon protein